MTSDSLLGMMAEPLVDLYRRLPDESIVHADLERWRSCREIPGETAERCLRILLARFPEFRTLFYYRLETAHGMRVLPKLFRRIYKPMPLLEIGCADIGPGLVISHGHGSILTAERIGANCWVHHQVTIGSRYSNRLPRLGDGVFVGVGAKILGDVDIGDGARIGANAVVIRDVPAGALAVGVPARVRLQEEDF